MGLGGRKMFLLGVLAVYCSQSLERCCAYAQFPSLPLIVNNTALKLSRISSLEQLDMRGATAGDVVVVMQGGQLEITGLSVILPPVTLPTPGSPLSMLSLMRPGGLLIVVDATTNSKVYIENSTLSWDNCSIVDAFIAAFRAMVPDQVSVQGPLWRAMIHSWSEPGLSLTDVVFKCQQSLCDPQQTDVPRVMRWTVSTDREVMAAAVAIDSVGREWNGMCTQTQFVLDMMQRVVTIGPPGEMWPASGVRFQHNVTLQGRGMHECVIDWRESIAIFQLADTAHLIINDTSQVNMAVINPPFFVGFPGWAIKFNRSSGHPQLVTNRGAAVVTKDEYTYYSFWSQLFDSFDPAVAQSAKWLNAFGVQDVKIRTGTTSAIIYDRFVGMGMDGTNLTLLSQTPLTSPAREMSGLLRLLDSTLDVLPFIVPIYTVADLANLIRAPPRYQAGGQLEMTPGPGSTIVGLLMNNITLNKTNWPSQGVLLGGSITLFSNPVAPLPRNTSQAPPTVPMMVLDFGGLSGAIRTVGTNNRITFKEVILANSAYRQAFDATTSPNLLDAMETLLWSISANRLPATAQVLLRNSVVRVSEEEASVIALCSSLIRDNSVITGPDGDILAANGTDGFLNTTGGNSSLPSQYNFPIQGLDQNSKAWLLTACGSLGQAIPTSSEFKGKVIGDPPTIGVDKIFTYGVDFRTSNITSASILPLVGSAAPHRLDLLAPFMRRQVPPGTLFTPAMPSSSSPPSSGLQAPGPDKAPGASTSMTSAIVGGVVGGVAVAAMGALLLILRVRRNAARAADGDEPRSSKSSQAIILGSALLRHPDLESGATLGPSSRDRGGSGSIGVAQPSGTEGARFILPWSRAGSRASRTSRASRANSHAMSVHLNSLWDEPHAGLRADSGAGIAPGTGASDRHGAAGTLPLTRHVPSSAGYRTSLSHSADQLELDPLRVGSERSGDPVLMGTGASARLSVIARAVRDSSQHQVPGTGLNGNSGSGSASGDVMSPLRNTANAHQLVKEVSSLSTASLGSGGPHELLQELHGLSVAMSSEIADKQLLLLQNAVPLGAGATSTVYRGTWQGLPVAVKSLVFSTHRKQAALQEAALSRSVCHPNIVSTYSYDLQPLTPAAPVTAGTPLPFMVGPDGKPQSSTGTSQTVVTVGTPTEWRLLIIQEYCEHGSLRDLIRLGRLRPHGQGSSNSAGTGASPGPGTGNTAGAGMGNGVAPEGGVASPAATDPTSPRASAHMHTLGKPPVPRSADVEALTPHPVDLATALTLAIDIASAMVHLHAKSIIHGDLKPENVLLTNQAPVGSAPDAHTNLPAGAWWSDMSGLHVVRGFQHVAKVADFGLSQRLAPGISHVSNTRVGSPFYVAPEVHRQGRVTKSADVFSFGVLLWELYNGRSAWVRVGQINKTSSGEVAPAADAKPKEQESAGSESNSTERGKGAGAGEPAGAGAGGEEAELLPPPQLPQHAILRYAPDFPRFPPSVPPTYMALCRACLSPQHTRRPPFTSVLATLTSLLSELQGPPTRSSMGSAVGALVAPNSPITVGSGGLVGSGRVAARSNLSRRMSVGGNGVVGIVPRTGSEPERSPASTGSPANGKHLGKMALAGLGSSQLQDGSLALALKAHSQSKLKNLTDRVRGGNISIGVDRSSGVSVAASEESRVLVAGCIAAPLIGPFAPQSVHRYVASVTDRASGRSVATTSVHIPAGTSRHLPSRSDLPSHASHSTQGAAVWSNGGSLASMNSGNSHMGGGQSPLLVNHLALASLLLSGSTSVGGAPNRPISHPNSHGTGIMSGGGAGSGSNVDATTSGLVPAACASATLLLLGARRQHNGTAGFSSAPTTRGDLHLDGFLDDLSAKDRDSGHNSSKQSLTSNGGALSVVAHSSHHPEHLNTDSSAKSSTGLVSAGTPSDRSYIMTPSRGGVSTGALTTPTQYTPGTASSCDSSAVMDIGGLLAHLASAHRHVPAAAAVTSAAQLTRMPMHGIKTSPPTSAQAYVSTGATSVTSTAQPISPITRGAMRARHAGMGRSPAVLMQKNFSLPHAHLRTPAAVANLPRSSSIPHPPPGRSRLNLATAARTAPNTSYTAEAPSTSNNTVPVLESGALLRLAPRVALPPLWAAMAAASSSLLYTRGSSGGGSAHTSGPLQRIQSVSRTSLAGSLFDDMDEEPRFGGTRQRWSDDGRRLRATRRKAINKGGLSSGRRPLSDSRHVLTSYRPLSTGASLSQGGAVSNGGVGTSASAHALKPHLEQLAAECGGERDTLQGMVVGDPRDGGSENGHCSSGYDDEQEDGSATTSSDLSSSLLAVQDEPLHAVHVDELEALMEDVNAGNVAWDDIGSESQASMKR